MPKHPESSKKTTVFITEDKSIVSMKAKMQPLSKNEKIMLNKIYNESILRLERAITLLNQLENYLSAKDDKNSVKDIKQLLIDENADPTILHALKMIKRHFYIDIQNNTIDGMLRNIDALRNNILKTLKGLEGQLDITLEILQNEPTQQDIKQFKNKTYALYRKDNTWQLSYYENKIKKNDIPIDSIDSNINDIGNVSQAQLNAFLLTRMVMLYHAKHVHSQTNKVYISNISLKQQYDKNNRTIGYVHALSMGSNFYYGAIHLDYRLLETNPYEAMNTLLHEASHRYGWVNDRGYYHDVKQTKDGTTRPFPNEVQSNTSRAMNNADSYAYFVCDMTGSGSLYTKENTPAWCNEESYRNKHKALPQENTWKSQLLKFSLFAVGAAAILGGAYCYSKSTRGRGN